MTNTPDNALALAGFTLAHATWSVSDLPDDELLVPLAIVERGEERELVRFEADTQEDAISEGKRAMAEANDAKVWAFAREGALRIEAGGEQQDALVVDFWAEGMEHPLTLIQPFERYTRHGRFRVVGDMIISSEGELLDSTSAEKIIEGINEGIREHPTVAELWLSWLEVKRKKKIKKSKRKEQDEARAATFFRICGEKLRPLLDEYGFIRAEVEDPGGYTYYTIIFQNETAALRVYFEWRDRYLSVQVCRLVDGKVQRDSESLDIEWTCFHVEDLLTVRVPEYDQKALQLPEEWLGEDATLEEIGQRLEKHADALRAHGGDVLRGDFSVFPELDKIAKQRAREREAEYDEILGLSEDDKLLGSIAAYDLAISIRPEDAHLYYDRGTAHHQLKQLDKAIADYDKALSLDPTDAKSYRERGIANLEMGEFALALADFDRALALDPTDALTFNSRGNLYMGLGDLTAALAEFDRAITLNPNDAMAYSNRGAIYSKLGDVPRAIDDYGEAIRHEPLYANSYANRAFAYYKLGEYEKGLADCERALELRPDHAASYSNRGLCHAALGDGERATSDFQRALSLPCPPAVREEALIGLRTLGLNIES